MRFVLILLSHIYGGDTVTVVPGTYATEIDCHVAGKVFDTVETKFLPDRRHLCIPAPRWIT